MKSLAFLCLICAPNLYFAQKLLRGTKNCWVTRTAKKLLQEPKVAQKLPSTIGTGLLVVVLPSVTDVFTPVILNWIGLQTILIATVSVKMVGTAGLWGLLVHSMLVYKIWWSSRDKQLWEGRGEQELEGKKQRLVKVSQLFLFETVACEQPLHLGESREITREPHAFSFGSLRSPLEMGSLLASYFIAAWSPERWPKIVFALKYV